MIAEHQFFRVRIEIGLVFYILDIEFIDIMFQKGQRHHQRHYLIVVVVDNAQNILLVIGIEMIFEKAENMMNDVGVFSGGCFVSKGLHKQGGVFFFEFYRSVFFNGRHQLPHLLIMFLAVSQQ